MKLRAARRFLAALPVLASASVVAALAGPPGPGRHAAELCVATLPKPASCGAALADVRADGTLRVRVDDVVYNLRLYSSQVEVVVMHNIVQIDEFRVPYAWVGGTLQFKDRDRNSVYEIRFGVDKPTPRP